MKVQKQIQLLRSERFRLGFLKSGWNAACLKADGTTPWIEELLKIGKMLGTTVYKTSLRNFVGKKSRLHVVGQMSVKISDKKDSETGWTWVKYIQMSLLVDKMLSGGVICCPIKSIFSLKFSWSLVQHHKNKREKRR